MEVQTEPLKGNPYVEYYRQVHQTQNWAAESSLGVGQHVQG